MRIGPRFMPMAVIAPLLAGCDQTSYTRVAGPKHDCAAAPDISIVADGRLIELTGVCNRVKVTGTGSSMVIASVRSLDVDGSKLSITAVEVGDLSVRGSDNIVRFSRRVAGAPNNSYTTGNNNRIIDRIE